MKCKNCGLVITAVDNGPKPYIAIDPEGKYRTFICFNGDTYDVNGHQPEGTPDVTGR